MTCDVNIQTLEIDDILRWQSNRAFVYFGRLAPSKGVDIVLRCWLDLADSCSGICPPLWLIGGSPKEISDIRRYTKLEERLVSYERDSRIMWWGYLDPPGVSAVLLRAIVLITHSHYEPGGRVIVEAMRQGIPAIATPHGFAPDLIADWVSGFLVPYGDEACLRQRMSLFLHQPFLSQAMGYQARLITEDALRNWDFFAYHYFIYDAIATKKSISASSKFPQPNDYPSVLKRRLVRLPGYIESVTDLAPIVEVWAESLLGGGANISLQAVGGKSLSWRATNSEDEIWIKHVHSHFRMTSAWLLHGPSEPCYSASAKFTSEIFNSADGIVRTLASNSEHYLIAQPVCSPLESLRDAPEQAAVMRQALDALADTPCPEGGEMFREIARKYFHGVDDFDYALVERDIKDCPLNRHSPWPLSYRSSLRLRLTLLTQAATFGKLLLPGDMKEEFVKLRTRLHELAYHEEHLPIVMLHNGAKVSHFALAPQGNVVLLDKERLSYGFKGKDHGELAANLLIRYPQANIGELICKLSDTPDEHAVTIAWMGLHLLAEAGFQLACERHEKLPQTLEAWNCWRQALEAIPSP